MRILRLLVVLAFVAMQPVAVVPSQRYFPTIQINQYHWPRAGFSVMGAFRNKMPILYAADGSGPPMWFGDWWLGCEMYSENGETYGRGLYHASYIPTVWGVWDAFLLRCNDGRPVLVGNEPEIAGQANLTPTEMAALLRTVVTSSWSGPVYCCGVMVQHQAYMAQTIAEYRRLYGAWPHGVGVHAHLYIVGTDGSPVVTSVTDANIARAQASFDDFMTLLSANGLLRQRVVVSECCALSRVLSQADVMRAAYSLVNHAMANGHVATVAWFTLFSGNLVDQFPSSDLVTGDQINELGQAWLEYAGRR